MARLEVGILGGGGYAGAELARILLFHPSVRLRLVASRSQAGRRLDAVHPNLRGLTDLTLEAPRSVGDYGGLDCLFAALPHGQYLDMAGSLPSSLRMIDLSGDFRLDDPQEFEEHYGRRHPDMGLQASFAYGLSEINRTRIEQARKIANPGCFATAALLGLFPLVAEEALEGRVVVDAKTGSSGSGASAKDTTHHPRRSNSLWAYKPFAHQHVPEILQALRSACSGRAPERFLLQAHSAPMVRGIFASIYCTLRRPLESDEIRELFRRRYGGRPFVRLIEGSPDVNWVKNTNFADIGWAVEGRDLIVFCAIDNLVKGAAGQAVQNMNLMFGLEERSGLVFAGSHP